MEELLKSNFEIELLVINEQIRGNINWLGTNKSKTVFIVENELKAISSLQSNNYGFAVAKKRPTEEFVHQGGFVLCLDGVQDPGNLGTIIRAVDWYGMKQILCGANVVDFYNPKVLQASMGSFARVKCYYGDFEKKLKRAIVYSADTQGERLHHVKFQKDCFLIMGNESHGISDKYKHIADRTISIPKYGEAESLNVALACGIICDRYKEQFP